MAFTTDDLAALDRAIANNQLEVEFNGRRVKFDSFDGLRSAPRLHRDRSSPTAQRPTGSFRFRFSHLARGLTDASARKRPRPTDRRLRPASRTARIAARTMLTRAYEAASPRDTWRPRRGGASAQADHFADATMLRNKARALVQNVPYVATRWTRWSPTSSELASFHASREPQQDTLNTLFEQLVSGVRRRRATRLLRNRGCGVSGHGAGRRSPDPPAAATLEDGLPVPLQLQLLEIDWLDNTRNTLARWLRWVCRSATS
jgi:hypothetical protein